MQIFAPAYTQTPNELFDQWLPLLCESELKVLLVVVRKTIGFNTMYRVITVSDIAKSTGMKKDTVTQAAKSLNSKGMITRNVVGPLGKQETIYSLNIIEDLYGRKND